MKAAYLQFAPIYLDVEKNWARVNTLFEGIDVDLIVLPELFSSGYFFRSPADLDQVAEPIPDGPTTQRLSAWAEDTGATIVAGLPERDGSRRYNSAVTVTPTGETHTYRKVHLYYEENELFDPGDLGFPVVEVSTRDGVPYQLGVMVCFE
jgi:predicted amidohydrolase